MFKSLVNVVLGLSLFVSMIGCASLKVSERYEYTKLESRLTSAGLEPEKIKDPTLAGALNVLPGIGNAYIGQWGLFAVNLLLWPISAAWGVPQAAVDAKTMNKQATLYYFGIGEGKAKLEQLEQDKAGNVTSKTE